MVKDIHQRLVSSMTMDIGLENYFVTLAEEHAANVVMSLLHCAPSCDRYGAQLPRELRAPWPVGPSLCAACPVGSARQAESSGVLGPHCSCCRAPSLPLRAPGLCHPAPRSCAGRGTDARLWSHRAAALMWRTIGSSGLAVQEVLAALLSVMEDGMFFSREDNEAIFALAVSFCNWPLLALQVASPAALHALPSALQLPASGAGLKAGLGAGSGAAGRELPLCLSWGPATRTPRH